MIIGEVDHLSDGRPVTAR